MSTIPTSPLDLQPLPGPLAPAPDDIFPYPPTDLVADDGEPLESDWHRLAMTLLIESVRQHWLGRTDYYVGGNMFIYFSAEQARNRDFRGPDFFLVKNVAGTRMRECWASWLEGGRLPDVIIELTSPTTKREDLGRKKEVYQDVFRTQEYYCYDPFTKELLGWRLDKKRYQPIAPDNDGRLVCEELGLTLGTWFGHYMGFDDLWLRFFDAAGNVVLTRTEAVQHELDHERQRADALEAEVARLRAQLEVTESNTGAPEA